MNTHTSKYAFSSMLAFFSFPAWANPTPIPYFEFFPIVLVAMGLLSYWTKVAYRSENNAKNSILIPPWSLTFGIIISLIFPPFMLLIYLAILIVLGGFFLLCGIINLSIGKGSSITSKNRIFAGAGMLGSAFLISFLVYLFLMALFSSDYNHGKYVRALGDIKGIELALTKMADDASIHSLAELFIPDAVSDYLADGIVQGGNHPVHIVSALTAEQFQRAELLYTRTLYALLREGSESLRDDVDGELHIRFSDVLNPETVSKLNNDYMREIGLDPWGTLYQMYLGPWPKNTDPSADGPEPNGNLIVFRSYSCYESLAAHADPRLRPRKPDALTVNYDPSKPKGVSEEAIDPETSEYALQGFPAPRDKFVYIYSLGKNKVSNQAIYSANGYSWKSYSGDNSFYFGGGDDINNWDNDQSWMLLYN